jgi:hypothetical protein
MLRIFSSTGQKWLRASTYGRGMWEYGLVTSPDFQLRISNPTQTVFAGQSATFNGSAVAFNGYNSSVALSCTVGSPSQCTPNPTSLIPTSSGASFTITASGAVGDYAFNAHGAGSDSNHTAHDVPLALHVVDFGLTAPNPGTVTANIPNSSEQTAFQVTASGSFAGSVALSCSGLPAGAACNFSPSSTVMPTSSNPANVTLTIGTTNSTPLGSFPIIISASAAGGPTKTQSLTLVVVALADYTIAISNPSQSAPVGTSATFNGTLTSMHGYASTVNLSCGAGAPPTCLPSPTSLTPTSAGAAFTVMVSSSAARSYGFNVNAQGTDSGQIAHSAPVTFNSTFEFSVMNTSGPQTVNAGLPATYSLDVAPAGSGNTFPKNVTFTCSGPPRTSCSFDPSQLNTGDAETSVVLTVSTQTPGSAQAAWKSGLRWAMWCPMLSLSLIGFGSRKARKRATAAGILMILSLFIGCGGALQQAAPSNPTGGTPPGSYSVTITASCGSLAHTMQVPLTVN